MYENPIILYRPNPICPDEIVVMDAGLLWPVEGTGMSQVQYRDRCLRQPLAKFCQQCNAWYLPTDYPGGCPKCGSGNPESGCL